MSASIMHLSRNSSDPSAFWKVNVSNCEDSKPPDILNGFKKIPVVVIKRYNIEKYLRKDNKEIALKPFKLKECSVRVLRLNLGTISVQPSETKPYLKCDVCEKIYYSEKKLENHKQIKHQLCVVQVKIPKKVTFCDEVTVFEAQLYHKCRKCPSIFKNYTDLKSHTKHKHKKRKCYICYFCDKQFVDRMFFKVHIKLHCTTCGILFDYKHECIAHRKLCMNKKSQQKCNYCLQEFASNCILKYHMAVMHRKSKFSYNELYITKMNSDSVEFICLFCKFVSVNWMHFQTHVNTLFNSNNKVPYKCDNCDNKFMKEEELIEHKQSHRVVITEDNHDSKFIKEEELIEHKQSHRVVITEDNHDSKFIKEEELIEHKKSHRVVITEDPLRSCDHNIFYGSKLNKTIPCYLNPIVLVRRTSNLEKYFNKLYKNKIKKKRVKLDISDHQCNICKKYFTTSYVLRRHISCVHLDFERNMCRDCNTSFNWASELINHECVYKKDANKEGSKNAVVDLTADVDVEDVDEMDDDDYEAMMIPAPIVELTEYENEYRFDNDGKMQIDNGLQLSKDNQFNNIDNNEALSSDNVLQLSKRNQFNNIDNNEALSSDNVLQLSKHNQFNNIDNNEALSSDNGLQLNYHNQLSNFNNNALTQHHNGLKLHDHNYCNNNNKVEKRVMLINNEGKLVVSTLVQCPPRPGYDAPRIVTMTPYQINNHFMTVDAQKTFHAVRFNVLQNALCNGLSQPVMPPLIQFADKDVANTNSDL